jgi:hypothetical protein
LAFDVARADTLTVAGLNGLNGMGADLSNVTVA